MRPIQKAWLLSLLLAAACNSGPASGFGVITLNVTDAAPEFSMVDSAILHVNAVRMHAAGDPVDQFTTIYDSIAPISIDLRSLVNGDTINILDPQLDPNTYDQIRLEITGGSLELTNGNVYSLAHGNITLVGTGELDLFLTPPVDLADIAVEDVLIDFDLTKTFVPVPGPDPLTATSYEIHPTASAIDLATAGEVLGLVSESDGGSSVVPSEGATVYLFAPGVTDPALAIKATGTDANGHYALLGVPEGTYDVQAIKSSPDGLSTQGDLQAGVVVTAGAQTTVNLSIQAFVGAVAGTVTQPDGMGGFMPADGATVLVLPPGVVDPLQAVATATTAPDGTYAATDVPPGTYDVQATLGPLTGTVANQVVTEAATTTVDILIL